MLKMNRYFNSAGASFLMSGLAPSQNMLTQFGQAALKSGGFGKLCSVPYGYGRPNAGLAPCDTVGGMSSFTSCKGLGTGTGAIAAGIGITGSSAGSGIIDATVLGVSWGVGTASGEASASGTIMGLGFLSGLSNGNGSATANIFAAVAITGTASGSSTLLGDGYLAVSLSGMADGSSLVYGSAAALVNTSGIASGTSEASAIIIGAYFSSGQAYGIGSAVGDIPLGYGWLTGQASGLCQVTLAPSAKGFMSGTTDVAAGELTADGIATAVWSYER